MHQNKQRGDMMDTDGSYCSISFVESKEMRKTHEFVRSNNFRANTGLVGIFAGVQFGAFACVSSYLRDNGRR